MDISGTHWIPASAGMTGAGVRSPETSRGFHVRLCVTLYYKKMATVQSELTARLSEPKAQRLEALCEITGESRSAVVRDSLRAYRLREALRHSQARPGPAARASGWLTEDDVLNDVS